MARKPTYDDLLAAMKRIADPDDDCHCGIGGPWQELAQIVLLGRAIRDGGEFYDQDERRLSITELMDRADG